LGKVIYDEVDSGIDSPIDFGDDGEDVGAWDSGHTLSLEDLRLINHNLSIYYENTSKSIKLFSSLKEQISVEVFNIIGVRVIDKKTIQINDSNINVSSLRNGVYILVAKFNGKSISKKFVIY